MSEENSNSATGKMLGTWFALLLLVSFCVFGDYAEPGEEGDMIEGAPCSSEDTVFEKLPYKDWASYYHGNVSTVVKAQMAQLEMRGSEQTLQCDSADFGGVLPATKSLEELARTLPPWKPRQGTSIFAGPAALPKVTAADFVPVLLEFVRIYECSLLELQAEGPRTAAQSASSTSGTMSSAASSEEPRLTFEEEQDIREQLATARPAMESTVLLISGMNRLQPFTAELQCLERLLADTANITGLLAQEAACYNRTLDGNGSLRDLQTP